MSDTRIMRADERLDEKVLAEMMRDGQRYAQWPPYATLERPSTLPAPTDAEVEAIRDAVFGLSWRGDSPIPFDSLRIEHKGKRTRVMLRIGGRDLYCIESEGALTIDGFEAHFPHEPRANQIATAEGSTFSFGRALSEQ